MSDFADAKQVAQASAQVNRLRENMRQVIRGKDAVIDRVIVCLLAGGHVLVEDLPGVGKTTLAYALARSLDSQFSRVQFTSDLLPTDVTGVAVYDERTREFVFKPGPVFANVVLADEINRATPKTQSALLEVMDRGKISVDGATHTVGEPFMVFATQNPVDYEGTFPLPESQMDRFLMRLRIGYPSEIHEREILQREHASYDEIKIDAVLNHCDVLALQALAARVFVEDSVVDHLLKIITATRTEAEFRSGVSVRGGIALKQAAQAHALMCGRDFVIPSDVTDLVPVVFIHRLSLARHVADALEERAAIEGILKKILSSLPEPT